MSEAAGLDVLSARLCPWLEAPLVQLEEAFAAGRLGHAWLLAGPRGVGKINLALVTARRLLERQTGTAPPPALGAADAVAAMTARHEPADHHPDLHWVFPAEDKRSIAIEQIRAISETLALKGYRGGPKVVVIEPAEEMTIAAANALLKTLEEPSADSYLLLVSHEPQRLPPTVRSRCQELKVRPPARPVLDAWLGPAQADAVEAALLLIGNRPLAVAAALSGEKCLNYKVLEETLELVSQGRRDPHQAVDEWLKLDVPAVLEWLVRRLELAIRARLAPGRSTAFTDIVGGRLHNAWRALTLRTLFEQHRAAERLLQQTGTGLNIELGLRVLLLGFQPDRDLP